MLGKSGRGEEKEEELGERKGGGRVSRRMGGGSKSKRKRGKSREEEKGK